MCTTATIVSEKEHLKKQMVTLGDELAVSLHFHWRKHFEHVIWYSMNWPGGMLYFLRQVLNAGSEF